MMHGTGDTSAAGDGWVAASKAYVGRLQAQFVLPDEGRLDDVDLAAAFGALAEQGVPGELVVPRFETRYHAGLAGPLAALGVPALFDTGNLLGIADDPDLVVGDVVHETWLAMDEQGTEAAAATAMEFEALGAPIGRAYPVVLDRPFWFRIWDPDTDATLFLGRITDPS
jgi:serpin B